MKNFKLTALSLFFFIGVYAQMPANSSYHISGQLNMAATPGKIYLSYKSNGKLYTDSTMLNNGKFYFAGELSEPVLATIRFVPEKGRRFRNTFNFFIEAATINLSLQDSLKSGVVTGSKTDQDFQGLRIAQGLYQSKLVPLNQSGNGVRTH